MQITDDSKDFKPSCKLVIFDFLVRHVLLNPQENSYADLVSSLHKHL